MKAAKTQPGASLSTDSTTDAVQEQPALPALESAGNQSSRRNTKAITVHLPGEVRRQLKVMAGEHGRDLADMVAEGLNLLFAKYDRPEIAPRKPSK